MKALAAAAAASAGSLSLGATANVGVDATQVGVTPLYLGYNMGHYTAAGVTTVPEPSSLALIAVGALLMTRRRRASTMPL